MKRAFYITVTTLLLAVFSVTANAQDTQQEPSTFPCFARTEGCVRDEYDRFQDKTFVRMTPTRLTFPPILGYPSSVYVEIGAEFSSPGKAIKRPEAVTIIFITSSFSATFADKKGVYLLLDGKPYALGDVSLEKESPREYQSRYSLRVPFEVVEKIASAKVVEIRVGSDETSLDEKIKSSFGRLIELVPKEERTVSPATEKAAPPEVKRPKQSRISRRRKRP